MIACQNALIVLNQALQQLVMVLHQYAQESQWILKSNPTDFISYV
ncbi:hypothetical protein SAMN04488023_11271 [Pedobacter rhizosphaerae]|uniref:Uncharacterized protein n=1 Tax=Pedobacter rhizosphaerae TaxID=390241 RepID=A0A1H9QN03_9SPHI|nr:hypothetical protein SAMN04488023_11271 [Pedobacter rhizosphaerae]